MFNMEKGYRNKIIIIIIIIMIIINNPDIINQSLPVSWVKQLNCVKQGKLHSVI